MSAVSFEEKVELAAMVLRNDIFNTITEMFPLGSGCGYRRYFAGQNRTALRKAIERAVAPESEFARRVRLAEGG